MEKKIHFKDSRYLYSLCGRNESNIELAEERFGVKITARGDFLKIAGQKENVGSAVCFFRKLCEASGKENGPAEREFKDALLSAGDSALQVEKIVKERIAVPAKKHFIIPRGRHQYIYAGAIKKYDIVFSIGPAGTGKTYIAVAMAVNALMEGRVSRIILTRPAVEAGEALGFLPGDMYEKVNPYLRPLYDALYDMMDADRIQSFREKGIIETAPLAYMRGRTLNDSFVILDEAQNTTQEQMKMFLTRLGFDSKTVITGDITQVDLPEAKPSGLIHVSRMLSGIKGIKFIYFDETDVVRHELVTEIIKAYERDKK